ncbi:MAG: hypothetical protein PHN38_09690 [Sulfurospirillaceae bacterium]|nr:hypothetical protein [Sulfurospirillaceae bacterium]
MDKEHLLLESYRIYCDSKEKFISRSFGTNKFYLVISLIISAVVVLGATKFQSPLLTVIFSAFGVMICSLWWFNQDSYDYLIKIKYRDVIQEMEKGLPFAPATAEFEASQERMKKKKVFVFNNAHKFLAFVMLLLFLVFLLINIGPYFVLIFSTEVL